MATVLEPGVAWAMFAKLGEAYKVTGRIALASVADSMVKFSRIEARKMGVHKLRTATPAVPGGPPAQISRALAKSIDRSIIDRSPLGWACRVGTSASVYNSYNPGGKPTSKYGLILERDGCKNGSVYPFLERACRYVWDIEAPVIYTSMYGQETKAWTRIF